MTRVAFFLSSLAGGGVERNTLTLAGALAERGHAVELVVCKAEGPLRSEVPDSVRLHALGPVPEGLGRLRVLAADPGGAVALARPVLLPLKASSKVRYLPALADHLRREPPDVLVSAMTNPNLVALWARRLAGVPTRVVVSERNAFSSYVEHFRGRWRWRHLPALVARSYPRADAIVAVADAVADDLAETAALDRERIRTIHNPVVTPELEHLARVPADHPWLAGDGPPVVLGVGSLSPRKGFATLLRAFARVRASRELRLVVLGEGQERGALEHLARELGIADSVSLPGWVPNPFAAMSCAAAFVLSSAWEGLPAVLIQAMACGCPVVSTDGAGGASEILRGGVHGALVPVGDAEALATAMASTLDTPRDLEKARQRARDYSLESSVRHWAGLVTELS
ncbi:MAG: glycosyltransferase [Myxococcota bacterium]|nr:glycosyltransferase [Myxococcota bacterium]